MDDLLSMIGIDENSEKENNFDEHHHDSDHDLSDIFDVSLESDDQDIEDTNVSIRKKEFDKVKEFFTKKPEDFIDNKDYYKNVLSGSKSGGDALNKNLQIFLKEKDPKERALLRNKVIQSYWAFVQEVIKYFGASNIKIEKMLMFRYGLISPSLLNADAKLLISHIFLENNYTEAIYYADEWIRAVGSGKVTPSTTDETKTVKKTVQTANDTHIEKYKASRQVIKDNILSSNENRKKIEAELKNNVEAITSPIYHSKYTTLIEPYTPQQKSLMSTISPLFIKLKSIDAELFSLYKELAKVEDKLESLYTKTQGENVVEEDIIDNDLLQSEFEAVRQMNKLCVGRQGNHMPILMSNFFVAEKNNIGTRENILSILTKIEEIEPGVFTRPHRRYIYRIPPNIVIVPCYGDMGICWEPLEKFNRATGRGRIAIPMFPKNLTIAVITAIADLRWQTAKEKAAHYWMEEGITGGYYQWSVENKIKGNIKDLFIRDYVTWITRESEGIQKLDKDVRAVFWRHIPFNQKIKDNLKNRGFAYNELYKRDLNRAMSDGY